MSMADLRETFFQECEDLLEAMAEGLRTIDETAADADTVNSVFRAVHSIKGGAGAFGLETLVQFAHGFETTLDGLRAGRIELSASLSRVLMHAGDHLSDLVAAARDEAPADEAASARLIDELEAAAGGPLEEEEVDFAPMALSFDLNLPSGPPVERFSIRFAPQSALYANGSDPALLLRDLEALGPVRVSLDDSALPPVAAFDWRTSYLAWDLSVETERGIEAVREVFEFVEGLCELEIGEEVASDPGAAPSPERPDDDTTAEGGPPQPEESAAAMALVGAAASLRLMPPRARPGPIRPSRAPRPPRPPGPAPRSGSIWTASIA